MPQQELLKIGKRGVLGERLMSLNELSEDVVEEFNDNGCLELSEFTLTAKLEVATCELFNGFNNSGVLGIALRIEVKLNFLVDACGFKPIIKNLIDLFGFTRVELTAGLLVHLPVGEETGFSV